MWVGCGAARNEPRHRPTGTIPLEIHLRPARLYSSIRAARRRNVSSSAQVHIPLACHIISAGPFTKFCVKNPGDAVEQERRRSLGQGRGDCALLCVDQVVIRDGTGDRGVDGEQSVTDRRAILKV